MFTFILSLIKMLILWIGIGLLCGGAWVFSRERLTKKNRSDVFLASGFCVLLGIGILAPIALG